MVLTGKAKKSFQAYFTTAYDFDNSSYLDIEPGKDVMEAFFRMPLSFKFGVYLDWFDSVDIRILIMTDEKEKFFYRIEGKEYVQEDGFPSRAEARKEAIERANEIYNERQIKKKKSID